MKKRAMGWIIALGVRVAVLLTALFMAIELDLWQPRASCLRLASVFYGLKAWAKDGQEKLKLCTEKP